MIQVDKAAAVAHWLRAVACKRKVERSNPGLDRPKLLKQVVTAPLQTLSSPSTVIVTSPNEWKILEWDEKLQIIKPVKLEHDGHIYIFWFSRTIQHNFNVWSISLEDDTNFNLLCQCITHQHMALTRFRTNWAWTHFMYKDVNKLQINK